MWMFYTAFLFSPTGGLGKLLAEERPLKGWEEYRVPRSSSLCVEKSKTGGKNEEDISFFSDLHKHFFRGPS